MPPQPEALSEERLLALLEQLLELPNLSLPQLLGGAANAIAGWLGSDKVDVFLLDPARQSLAAIGTSDTELGRKQHALGLDVLPLANGGRTVEVFQTGHVYATGDSARDGGELIGIVRDLGVRSQIALPLEINGVRRGVLLVTSQQPERYSEVDRRLCEVLARWLGTLAHRTELAETLRREERERARRITADEIVTVLAHDFRNLLAPLHGRLQIMRLKLEDARSVELADVEAASSSVEQLQRLTGDLLDVARLDQGLFELRLDRVDVAKLARDVAASLAGQREIQVEVPARLMIVADANRLRQALENVVSNALKHSPPPGPVHLVVKRHGRSVTVDVIDSGPGIRPELLPRLFHRYVSGHGSKGLGLGLYLAKSITDAHGGALTVTSSSGSGSRFRFTLPARDQ